MRVYRNSELEVGRDYYYAGPVESYKESHPHVPMTFVSSEEVNIGGKLVRATFDIHYPDETHRATFSSTSMWVAADEFFDEVLNG